eukprot:scaffold614_cov255-Pinguiococcus_pyrenoidosus.AAC.10
MTNVRHLHSGEVQECPARRRRTEVLSSFLDTLAHLPRCRQPVPHLGNLHLGVRQEVKEIVVVQETSFTGAQALHEKLVMIVKFLRAQGKLFCAESILLFQTLLLLAHNPSEQLVFQDRLRNSEVHQSRPCLVLGGKVGTRE